MSNPLGLCWSEWSDLLQLFLQLSAFCNNQCCNKFLQGSQRFSPYAYPWMPLSNKRVCFNYKYYSSMHLWCSTCLLWFMLWRHITCVLCYLLVGNPCPWESTMTLIKPASTYTTRAVWLHLYLSHIRRISKQDICKQQRNHVGTLQLWVGKLWRCDTVKIS